MRKMVKRLLKKYHYPPEEAEHALEIVLKQCEEWADEEDAPATAHSIPLYAHSDDDVMSMAAEP